MLCPAEAPQIQIPPVILFVKTKLLETCQQYVQPLLALAAADNLADAGHKHVHSRDGLAVVVQAHYGLYIGTGVWQTAGWGTIIYLAALAGVDVQMYEAAMIEGANRWQRMWYITLPSILPLIMVNLVLQLGNMFDVGVEKTLLLSNAMNRDVAEVFDSYVYNRGVISGEYSFSTAVGLFKSTVGIILVLGANWLSKKVSDEAIY